MKKPKVALVHEYLVQYGGAEKTLEAIMELYPDAPVYTGLYSPKLLSKNINDRKVISPKNSLLGKFPKYLTFLMPLVFESFDLREYDVVISDGTAWPKGVLTKPDQLHISYVHTPPRFLYKYSVESAKRDKWYFKPVVGLLDMALRIWDYNAAQRPDHLLVNSEETLRRVQKFYSRDAQVIYPPVDLNSEVNKSDIDNVRPPYYIALGRLSAYKNFDLLIETFNLLETPLVVVGTGIEEKKLKRAAKPNITFMGKVSEHDKHLLLEGCLGLINPVVEEDFGIVPVEAMSHGKPVLAHRSGGALEMITEGVTGKFFDHTDLEHLMQKIKEFDAEIKRGRYDQATIKKTVRKFEKERFKQEFKHFVDTKWEEKQLVKKAEILEKKE